jgi:3-hydroxymyristoyl/3-hydroxydecanoyl-(acyl carrier protein) dehydratase
VTSFFFAAIFLMIEAAAQLAGIVGQSDPSIPPLAALKLAALRGVKILGAARPGDVLHFEARVVGRMGNLIQAEAQGRVGDKILLAAQLTLSGDAPSA